MRPVHAYRLCNSCGRSAHGSLFKAAIKLFMLKNFGDSCSILAELDIYYGGGV